MPPGSTRRSGASCCLVRLFERLAAVGKIMNREKFRPLGETRNQRLFEFKSFQVRLLGGVRSGGRFVVAHGVTKKKDKHSPQDLEIAARILSEHDDWNLT